MLCSSLECQLIDASILEGGSESNVSDLMLTYDLRDGMAIEVQSSPTITDNFWLVTDRVWCESVYEAEMFPVSLQAKNISAINVHENYWMFMEIK